MRWLTSSISEQDYTLHGSLSVPVVTVYFDMDTEWTRPSSDKVSGTPTRTGQVKILCMYTYGKIYSLSKEIYIS